MPDYSDIIERLEKATAPDREVDGLIAISRGWTFQKMKGDAKSYWRKPGETDYYMRSDLPNFTGSIDVALTLVPEGWEWTLHCETEECRVEIGDPQIGLEGRSETPAIALCIAALKARAALAEK